MLKYTHFHIFPCKNMDKLCPWRYLYFFLTAIEKIEQFWEKTGWVASLAIFHAAGIYSILSPHRKQSKQIANILTA